MAFVEAACFEWGAGTPAHGPPLRQDDPTNGDI